MIKEVTFYDEKSYFQLLQKKLRMQITICFALNKENLQQFKQCLNQYGRQFKPVTKAFGVLNDRSMYTGRDYFEKSESCSLIIREAFVSDIVKFYLFSLKLLYEMERWWMAPICIWQCQIYIVTRVKKEINFSQRNIHIRRNHMRLHFLCLSLTLLRSLSTDWTMTWFTKSVDINFILM